MLSLYVKIDVESRQAHSCLNLRQANRYVGEGRVVKTCVHVPGPGGAEHAALLSLFLDAFQEAHALRGILHLVESSRAGRILVTSCAEYAVPARCFLLVFAKFKIGCGDEPGTFLYFCLREVPYLTILSILFLFTLSWINYRVW